MSSCNFISVPVKKIGGTVMVPGDKSMSHRAIILGSIAQGITTINGFLESMDCLHTIMIFRALQVRIEGPFSGQVIIYGRGKYALKAPLNRTLDCGNAGTCMRLVAGVLAAQSFPTILYGDSSLNQRPMERIARPLTQMGARIKTTKGHAPLLIDGHSLQGICYELPEASAQVKSCLLLAGLYAEGETTLIESTPTRDHTERMLTAFSYPLQKTANSLSIHSKSELMATDINIPGDHSSAAFFIVAAILIPNSKVIINGVGMNAHRIGMIHILRRMGATINISNTRFYGEELVGDIEIKSSCLSGINIPSKWVVSAIDEFPIIFIAAACATGQTVLQEAKELRYKESDRINAMVQGLSQLGIEAYSSDDSVCIRGGILQGGMVDAMGDHRIAMAFAVAGAVANASVLIKNCDNVATSFPNFIDYALKLGLIIREIR